MNHRMPLTTIVVLLFIALASIGVGYALWSKALHIDGTVKTGTVDSVFALNPFTDDDNKVDSELDSGDTGDCEISVWNGGSCDPAETGPDPKTHYQKDVGLCQAALEASDSGLVHLFNGYPSYHCTAWFRIHNTGSVPVKVASIKVNGQSVSPGVPVGLDLTQDQEPDLSLQVTDIETCQQIDPGQDALLNIDQHVLQGAPQDKKELTYKVEVQLNQWNEGCGRALLYYGNGGLNPGHWPEFPGEGDLYELKAFYEGLGYGVDYTDSWPSDLGIYKLLVLYGPGIRDDSGANFFSAAQVASLKSYLAAGGRVVVMGDWGGRWGIKTVNDLLGKLGVGIAQNADAATPDGDYCAPMGDTTADQITTPPLLSDGTARLDPSATSSLTLSGSAKGLARTDAAGCGATPGLTWMAVDRLLGPGGVIVIGDLNLVDDYYGFSDPWHDGYSGAAFGANLIGY